jgi:cytoskeletal protein RodZ
MSDKPDQSTNQITEPGTDISRVSRTNINDNSYVNKLNDTSNSSQTEKKCGKKTKWIIISVIAAVVIAAAIVIVIIVTKKKDKKPSPGKIIDSTTSTSSPTETPTEKPSETPTQTPTEKPSETPTQTPTETEKISPTQTDTKPTSETTTILNTVPEQDKLQSEFKINTNKGDLKNIKVVQKSYDQSKFNDQIISTDTIRETNYDIFILSEEDAKGEDQLFYNKMYTGAISIANECYYSSKDECDYKELIDLKKIKEDPSKMRILEDNVNFKNIPLAICLFNITDNDFITSITCHKELPDMKKK